MQITQALQSAVACRPDGIATVCGSRRHTFIQFRDRISRLAAALQSLGVGTGDRVGILALNSDRYVEAYMAVPWAGAVINPSNTRWSAAEIAYSLDDCVTRVLLIDDPFLPFVADLRAKSSSLATLIHVGDGPTPEGMLSYEALIEGHTPAADAGRGGQDLAGIFYTGGTTGFPKGVMLSHEALLFNGLWFCTLGVVLPGDVGLHAAPMFHLADHVLLNALWLAGGTHVTLPAFTPPAMLQVLERERITTTVLVPTMIQLLVDHPDAAKHDLSALRVLAYGGSPISEAVLDRAQKLMPHVNYGQAYGMTELAPCATWLPAALHSAEGRARGKLSAAGLAMPGVQVRVVGPDGRELPRGEVGEIIAKSSSVMLGYWNKPEETAQALERPSNPGWMHTGDGGRMDDEGFVFVVDRVKDMIVSGGENVYSTEVERAVARHPAVAACAVIGVPDAERGERVHAVVVLRAGQQATADEIREHCKTLIGSYKCPRSVEFITALPMSGAGKVLKRTLREPYWKGEQRQVA